MIDPRNPEVVAAARARVYNAQSWPLRFTTLPPGVLPYKEWQMRIERRSDVPPGCESLFQIESVRHAFDAIIQEVYAIFKQTNHDEPQMYPNQAIRMTIDLTIENPYMDE